MAQPGAANKNSSGITGSQLRLHESISLHTASKIAEKKLSRRNFFHGALKAEPSCFLGNPDGPLGLVNRWFISANFSGAILNAILL